MLAIILALNALAPPSPAPPVRYHITSKSTSDVDLSAMGQGVQSFAITLSAYVSVTVSDSGSGHLVHVVIDSSTFDGGAAAAMLPPELTADARGAVYHMYVVSGKAVTPVVPTPMSMQAAQLAPALAMLLPGFRGAKSGDSWADTTSADTTVSSNGVSANSSGKSVTTWTVKTAADGMQDIDGVTAGTTTVGGAQMQMEMQMNGTAHTTAPAGSLATSASSKSIGQANMTIAGSAVPMRVTMEIAATKLP